MIACACTITLSIENSATTLVNSYENKFNIEATLSFNRENLMSNFTPGSDNAELNIEKFNDVSSITIDEINNYGDSEYVEYYYYTYRKGMNSSTLTPATDLIDKATTETSTTTKKDHNGFGPGREETTTTTTTKHEEIKNLRGSNGDFTVKGYSSYEGMEDFINGNYSIIEGEVSDDFTSNSCVINSELAVLNELSVGDTITLVNTNDESFTYELIITGIYEDSSDSSDDMINMFTSSANTIITNTTLVEKIISDDDSKTATITPTFILKDKNVIEKFSEEVTSKGLNENYQIMTNLETIQSETKSINNVKTFVTTFLIITLVIIVTHSNNVANKVDCVY